MKISVNITIPRYVEEQTILKECTHLLGTFLDLCENSPEQICESNLHTFFDAYTHMEAIQQKLSLSKWPNGQEFSRIAKNVLDECKSRFDELEISIQHEYDDGHIEKLKGFEKIRAAF